MGQSESTLYSAAEKGDLNAMRELLTKGVDPNGLRDESDKWTPLLHPRAETSRSQSSC